LFLIFRGNDSFFEGCTALCTFSVRRRCTRVLNFPCAGDRCEVLWGGVTCHLPSLWKDLTLAEDVPISSVVFVFHNLKSSYAAVPQIFSIWKTTNHIAK
jgi:hypothetical protein